MGGDGGGGDGNGRWPIGDRGGGRGRVPLEFSVGRCPPGILNFVKLSAFNPFIQISSYIS